MTGGVHRESFVHSTLGQFDVTGLRELIAEVLRRRPDAKPSVCRFADVAMAGDKSADPHAHLLGAREIDRAYAATLTDAQLAEPLIYVEVPAGTDVDTVDTQLLVDGAHRYFERHRRGMESFEYWLVPLGVAPRLPLKSGLYRDADGDVSLCIVEPIPWGEKELVPGVGLVDRSAA